MENQINRAEKMMQRKGESAEPKRLWFQTHKERLNEKERFKLASQGLAVPKGERDKKKKQKGDNQKQKRRDYNKERKKGKKKMESNAEDRAQSELNKVMLLQARVAKKMNKPKSMRQKNEVEVTKPSAKKKAVPGKSGSAFANDLTDTSRTSVKKFRYQANSRNDRKGGSKARKPGVSKKK